MIASTYDSHRIWLGQIRTDTNILGVYHIQVSTNWASSNAVLAPNGSWVRLTIVCDGSSTKFYTNGNDTPIGSQNHSYPRAEDTGAAREVFIVGNADYNRKGIGDLYGFRLYNENYLPSEIADPIGSISQAMYNENLVSNISDMAGWYSADQYDASTRVWTDKHQIKTILPVLTHLFLLFLMD